MRDGIRRNLTSCDAAGCEAILINLNNITATLHTMAKDFVLDLPYLRDGLDVFSRAEEIKSAARRKLTPLTDPRFRVDNETARIQSLASLLVQQAGTGGFTSSVQAYADVKYGGAVLFDKSFDNEFVTGMFNATNSRSSNPENGTDASGEGGADVLAAADPKYIINAIDGETYTGTLVGPRFVGNLRQASSLRVGEGVVVTLFQPVVVPPAPFWWPVFWLTWANWWRILYTPLVVTQPRTFFAKGEYPNLGGYIADYNDRVVALRVDRLTMMTALRKAAIMKRLKEDLVAVQQLLDNTPGKPHLKLG